MQIHFVCLLWFDPVSQLDVRLVSEMLIKVVICASIFIISVGAQSPCRPFYGQRNPYVSATASAIPHQPFPVTLPYGATLIETEPRARGDYSPCPPPAECQMDDDCQQDLYKRAQDFCEKQKPCRLGQTCRPFLWSKNEWVENSKSGGSRQVQIQIPAYQCEAGKFCENELKRYFEVVNLEAFVMYPLSSNDPRLVEHVLANVTNCITQMYWYNSPVVVPLPDSNGEEGEWQIRFVSSAMRAREFIVEFYTSYDIHQNNSTSIKQVSRLAQYAARLRAMSTELKSRIFQRVERHMNGICGCMGGNDRVCRNGQPLQPRDLNQPLFLGF